MDWRLSMKSTFINNVIKLIFIYLFIILNIAVAGECVKVESQCIEGREARKINGISITKDCWMYRDAYRCSGFAKNNCAPLIEDGCVQVNLLATESNELLRDGYGVHCACGASLCDGYFAPVRRETAAVTITVRMYRTNGSGC
ncbi:MAG: hypothetical protein EOO61_10770 [Hymenobacter sp.]|nr:MAG: hypothetical protein EOO61_10770 [Hymenobacter sp.]